MNAHIHKILLTRDNLYICENGAIVTFGWFSTPYSSCSGGSWKLVAAERQASGAAAYDAFLKSALTINVQDPANTYPDINSVWSTFEVKLGAIGSLLSYEPVMRDFIQLGYQEMLQDKVQYMEIRTVLPDGVCRSLDNCDSPLSAMELAALYKEVTDEFTASNPTFCGVSMIYAPVRRVDETTVQSYLDTAQQLMNAFPGFFVGFDLVGQEDLGRPLIDFADEIIAASTSNPNLNFYFHAAETNWQGQETDINVIDALLLGTKRIGHGYGIAKHPEAKRLALENDVPVEVNPISNQVLGLVHDLRNHPAAILIQEGFPVVISSDDPGAWDAYGLSWDFYEAFMGLASRDMDLRLLKQLTFGSIRYSALDASRKDDCLARVQLEWDIYMQLQRSL